MRYFSSHVGGVFTQRPRHTSPKGISYCPTKDILNLSERMLYLAIHALDCDVGLCLMIWNPIFLHEQFIWVYKTCRHNYAFIAT